MNRKGFTLIEVMVTVTIIALLSVMVISGYSQQQKRSRDARRIADVGSLGIAIESYNASHGSYPADNAGTSYLDGRNIQSNLVVLANEGLINNLPTDPKVPKTYTGGDPEFCINYAYKGAPAGWTNNNSALYTETGNSFNGVSLLPRRWALYFGTELAAPNNKHPLDNSIPATRSTTWCGPAGAGGERGYAILLGPLQQ